MLLWTLFPEWFDNPLSPHPPPQINKKLLQQQNKFIKQGVSQTLNHGQITYWNITSTTGSYTNNCNPGTDALGGTSILTTALPFNFLFDTNIETTVSITVSGGLVFNGGYSFSSVTPFPISVNQLPSGGIFAYMDNLVANPANGFGVCIMTSNSSEFEVQWNAQDVTTSSTVQFRIILYSTGVIQMDYLTVPSGVDSSTGVQGADFSGYATYAAIGSGTSYLTNGARYIVTPLTDQDNDGDPAGPANLTGDGDCNDTNPNINRFQIEVCDGIGLFLLDKGLSLFKISLCF